MFEAWLYQQKINEQSQSSMLAATLTITALLSFVGALGTFILVLVLWPVEMHFFL